MASAFNTLTRANRPTVFNLRIIHPTVGPSIRTIGTGSGSTSVVATSSFRYREAHRVEGFTATLLERYDEVVGHVADSVPEPIRIVGVIDGKEHSAIPDRARLLMSGTRQLVECKDGLEAFYHPKAFIQGVLTEAAAEAMGYDYVQITPAALGAPALHRDVARIYGCRSVHVPDRARALAIQLLADGPMTLGALGARMHGNEVNGFAMVCAMMVRRVVEIDLTGPLANKSLVRLMPPIPRGLPSIRRNRNRP